MRKSLGRSHTSMLSGKGMEKRTTLRNQRGILRELKISFKSTEIGEQERSV